MRIIKIVLTVYFFSLVTAKAQEVDLLSKSDAVDIALENNYDIKIAEGN